MYMSVRYKPRKTYEWTANLAYCVGLVASDGCLSSDKRHIDLTSKDIQLLETYRSIISTSAKIGSKKNGAGQLSYRVQVSDVSFYDFLLAVGLTPNKSKTLGPLIVADIFYRDFLRGYFDGDGTIHGYWDKRWANSLMYYCEFTSASNKFLSWMKQKNKELILLEGGRIKRARSAESLSYAKTDSKKIYRFMYYSDDVPCLARKRSKFVDFIDQDPYSN